MNRFIDLATFELRKQKTASPVISELTKRGSGVSFPFPVQFVNDSVVTELPADPLIAPTLPSVTLGFKALHSYDAVSYVAGPFTATKTGTGLTTVYTFIVSFATAALDLLLATNLDEVELAAEIKWGSGLLKGETLAFDWIVQNNVNRGGETVSVYPVTAVDIALPAITRLTGGILATDLDAQALAGFANGSKFRVVTDLGGSIFGETAWQKRVGAETLTDLGNGFIFCVDGTRLYRVAG
jgi:hypothetical protein